MKLHHLRLKGIGPFRDTVDLDFAALGASGLFLLEGPTGSGKSTILDAIVYALYGSVAGGDAKLGADRVRSQFAPPTEPSMVDLIFETGAGIYRVRREPEYQRAKQRGTGTTKENAKAVLWRLGSPDMIDAVLADAPGTAGDITPLSSRLDEVGAEITRAIGLTRQQFTQTVLLPQGEFARFLTATTKDRQAVLTRVFGTEIFEEVEGQLVEMRKDARRAVSEASGMLAAAAARFTEAAGCAPEVIEEIDALVETLDGEGLARQAARMSAAVAAQAEEARAAATTATEREVTARAAQEAARGAERRALRRRELDALAARLASQAEQAGRDDERLLRDHAAGPVIAVADRASAADVAAGKARELFDVAVARARATAPDLVSAMVRHEGEDAAAVREELVVAVEGETARAGALEPLAAVESTLEARRAALAQRDAAAETMRAQIADLEAMLATRPDERTVLLAARDAARRDAEGLAEARLSLRTAQERSAAAAAVVAQSATVDAATAEAETALAAARAAQDAEHGLRRRRVEGLAAELALGLAPGEACPVCGAVEHPAPASADADHVDAEAIDAAEAARQRAEAAAATAVTELEVARERLSVTAAAAGGLDREAAKAAEQAARTAVEAAEVAVATARAAEAAVEEHDLATRRQQEEAQARRSALGEHGATSNAERQRFVADQESVEVARGDASTVEERRAMHQDRARTARDLLDAFDALGHADARRDEASRDLDGALDVASEALTEAGSPPFDGVDAARAARLSGSERGALAEAAERRRVELARLADGMAEPGIAETMGDDEHLAAVREVAETATTELTAASELARSAQGEAGRSEAAARRTTEAHRALTAALSEIASVRETAGTVLRVADLAAGLSADGDRVRLSTFVLMRRFEDVIAAANSRLAQLSGADLELERATTGRGAQRTGLDLRVIDRRTDQSRVPETLSGGETFFVSLALALGLADIVSAEAGGVQMQTLFIDEGFGSLDPERLDAVLEEIGHLAETGRTVGIVSHVAELKTRIPEQIHVRRRRDRTSTVTVTA